MAAVNLDTNYNNTWNESHRKTRKRRHQHKASTHSKKQ